jgi:putative peptidoglycan lipid II flippase
MDGGREPAEQDGIGRRRPAVDRDVSAAAAFAVPLDPRAFPEHPGIPAQGMPISGPLSPDAEDPDDTPPWDRPSGQIPVVAPALQSSHGSSPVWDWQAAVEQSIPGMGIGEMVGTGKVPAVVPLAPGQSGWSRGFRAPAAGTAEPEEQPSVQMRALRVGNLVKATSIVSGAMLASKVLGLVRTSFFASVFGAGPSADAFVNAFALPDAIFTVVAGGALASAFIPVFADYLIEKRDRKTAWHIASSALNISMVVLTALAILGIIFAPQFLNLTLHSYYVDHPDEFVLIVHLTRIMLLQPVFLGGATILVAVLQARQRFMLPALGQVIYTASLIGGIAATYVDRRTHVFGGHLEINGPAYGVVVGAFLQLAVQVPGLFAEKMEYRLSLDFLHPGVREMFRLMVPRMLNSALLFVSVFINRDLLGTLDTGAVYGYVTAFTLVMLPISIFGMASAQAAFPTLAALVAAGDWPRLRETIMRSVRGITYLAVPSSLGLIVLADPLTRLLLVRGRFLASDISAVANPLIFFSIGLLGLSLVEILTRSFYALHDSRTAVEVSVLQFMFVIGMSLVVLQPMGAGGLALATSIGSLGEALVLLLLLRPRLGGLNLKEFGAYLLNVLAASVVTALAALFVYTLGTVVLPSAGTVVLAVRIFAAIGVACVVYYVFSRFLGIDDVISLDRLLRRVLRR